MVRRLGFPSFGIRYCGNTNTTEVHDLDNELVVCQINEIIQAGHVISFKTLDEAHRAGHDNCHYCIGGFDSTRFLY